MSAETYGPVLGSYFTDKATFKNVNGTLVDPSAFSVKWYNPAGTLKGTYTSPTYVSQGVYLCGHQTAITDSAGIWTVEWTVTIGGKTDIFYHTIDVPAGRT